MFDILSKDDSNLARDIYNQALKCLRNMDRIEKQYNEETEKYQGQKEVLHDCLIRSIEEMSREKEILSTFINAVDIVFARYGNIKKFKAIKAVVVGYLFDYSSSNTIKSISRYKEICAIVA